MIIEWIISKGDYYIFYVWVTIDMKYAFILSSLMWPKSLLKGNKTLEIRVESINGVIYTIISLLETFCSVPFKFIPYSL